MLLCQADNIGAIIEVTGTVEFAAHLVLKAIEHHKHVILMNAELDGTVGPILKVYADKARSVTIRHKGYAKLLPSYADETSCRWAWRRAAA
jgi:predicted homoserine dehydrogenase-like protein